MLFQWRKILRRIHIRKKGILWQLYHDNGQVAQTGFYTLDNKLEGEWISYDAVGKKLQLLTTVMERKWALGIFILRMKLKKLITQLQNRNGDFL